jgi:hypothetical protein
MWSKEHYAGIWKPMKSSPAKNSIRLNTEVKI